MSTVPNTPQQPSAPDDWHPSWCLHEHTDLAMHRGASILVRDRDDIRIEAYLVIYGTTAFLSLDIASAGTTTLIELTTDEARRVVLSTRPLVEGVPRHQRNGGPLGRL